VPTAQARSEYGTAAAEQTEHEQHERDHQQRVNEATNRVDPDDAEEPSDEENNRDCVKHLSSAGTYC
jgi:hypothetical protein